MNRSVRNDLLAGIAILVVVAVFASRTGDIYVDPFDPGFTSRDFPVGVLGITTLLALILIGKSVPAALRAQGRFYESGELSDILRYVAPMVAIGFAYLWLIGMFQYLLPTFLATAAVLVIFGNRGIGRILTATAIITLGYYVLFYGVLGMYETPGSVWSYDARAFFQPLRRLLGLA